MPQYFAGTYKLKVDIFGRLSTSNSTALINLGCSEYPFVIASLSSTELESEESV